jgi:ATP-dependent Clp protease, protease subunit
MRKWFQMKAEDGVGEIVIYDEIGKSFWGEDTVSAKSFLDTLAALGEVNAITLRINSPGGDVFDGLAIHNALKNHAAKVTARIDGLAASAASYIAMAADTIVMPANAFMLVHQAAGFALGTADDMRSLADDLDRIDDSITATYVARTGMTTVEVKALMKEDRLMGAAEAKELGFADKVVKETKMAANYSLRLLPAAAATRFRAATTGSGQGDPPLPPAPEKPEELPAVVPPASPEPELVPIKEPPAAKVVDLNAAKQQGIEEHRAYVAAVTDLCTLARASGRVGDYVRANTPVDQVRKELLSAAAEVVEVLPQHPLAAKASASAWTKITDKLNARVKS